MFEDLICNKYFVITLVIVIIILLWLYIRKRSCGIEGMENVPLTLNDSDVTERAWGGNDVTKYRCNKNKVKRKDEVYQKYMDFGKMKGQTQLDYDTNNVYSGPKPIDDRPDLGNCVPCQVCEPCPACPGDKKYDDFFDSETTENNGVDYGHFAKKSINNFLSKRKQQQRKN